jgi:muramoyltetrapeptide carboxypeptidase
MLCDDFTRPDASAMTLDSFASSLSAGRHVLRFGADDNPDLQVEGKLWGGNLAMLLHLVGTPYFPSIEGGILFIEDVAEHPFRVERMLLQLHYAGVLQKQKAIVFGDFTSYKLGPIDNGYDFDGMLAYLRATVGVPMLTGLSFGHVKDKFSLMVGADDNLTCRGGQVELDMPGWRAPK